jgi:hypothetical protein
MAIFLDKFVVIGKETDLRKGTSNNDDFVVGDPAAVA